MLSDDSKGTSTQTIVNDVESEGERSIMNTDRRDSIHSDWSDLLSVDKEAEYKNIYTNTNENIIGVATTSDASATKTIKRLSASLTKKTIRNIVLVPYTPKQTDWGSWPIRSPYVTSTIAGPPAVQ